MLVGAAMLLASATSAPDPIAVERRRLTQAKQEAARAAARARDLERRAAQQQDAVARAQAEEKAVGARIRRAEADVAAARARLALVEALLARQRAELGERQQPVARLVAALASLARRPAAAAIVQPGSVSDLVHVRAVLGSTLPAVRRDTAALRTDLAETRKLRADATLATAALDQSRTALLGERQQLAALRARHAAAALQYNRDALIQSDRAIAMGEEARDIIDRMAAIGETRATLGTLAALPPPPAAPAASPSPPARTAAYRLPVAGTLVTGLGEVSENGVRARGLTLAVPRGAAVVAPAAGQVVFARPFRRFGTIVVIDHGAGWNTLVTGLGSAGVTRGSNVAAGQAIGRAPRTAPTPQITVELRRRGQPVDITALLD
ncbi:peptidoglycan DD-metalloendopeptidase family protein [Sphingomonas sp. ABOLG]|uniref:murein hydrolase activator EnvC family protein n=2 Tax=Sphingomonas TaxID=13687 RepID=UPI001F4949FC|nr:peptidoglycan DD-metalloendopeptidase family protein [Sphingomonas sp. ABOLG]